MRTIQVLIQDAVGAVVVSDAVGRLAVLEVVGPVEERAAVAQRADGEDVVAVTAGTEEGAMGVEEGAMVVEEVVVVIELTLTYVTSLCRTAYRLT